MSTPNHNTELEEILQKLWDDAQTDEAELHDESYSLPDDMTVEKARAVINTYLYQQTLELIPKDWPVDTNEDKSPLMTFNKARNSAYAEVRRAAAERWGVEDNG